MSFDHDDAVTPEQRFRADRPCPICGGDQDHASGTGQRCYGFFAGNGKAVYCTRIESDREHPQGGEAFGWYHELDDADAVPPKREQRERRAIETYEYRNASGKLLRKKFRFPDGEKRWAKIGAKVTVPYKLPELRTAVANGVEVVFIADGEGCVEALMRHGVVATCAPNGMGSWKAAYSKELRGVQRVVIVQDKDNAGARQARKVKRSLVGAVPEVVIVQAKYGKDARAHLEAGYTVAQLVPVDRVSVEEDVSDDDSRALAAIPVYPIDALPTSGRALVEHGMTSGLPPALVGGAVLAALATAIGGNAEIEVSPTWHERAILWVPLIAPAGAGKSPSHDLAFEPLRAQDALLTENENEDRILFSDMTLEALARSLYEVGGSAALDMDELDVLLSGLGEYKKRSGDHGRFLGLWSGMPWRFVRVGSGKQKNAVNLSINRPTLVICGSLPQDLHSHLGSEGAGFRQRWLPHLAEMPGGDFSVTRTSTPGGWSLLLTRLIAQREQTRKWRLTDAATDAFTKWGNHWRAQLRDRDTPASVAGALAKAPGHLARIALVLAEAGTIDQERTITADTIARAAQIMNFVIDCWRALPEHDTLSLSPRDARLDERIDRLIAWLDSHGGEATRRDLQRACVAGCRTATDLDALLGRYDKWFPGCVYEVDRDGESGPKTIVVKSPPRRARASTVGSADSSLHTDEKPHEHAENTGVGSADSSTADSSSADSSSNTNGGRRSNKYRIDFSKVQRPLNPDDFHE